MLSHTRQQSFPVLSPSKSNSSLPIDISKTLDKSNYSSKDKCIKYQIFPYTISTTDQSSFRSVRHSKPTNPGFTSPIKKINSLKTRMNSLLNTLNRKNISQEQYLIQKQLVNKYFENSRNCRSYHKDRQQKTLPIGKHSVSRRINNVGNAYTY